MAKTAQQTDPGAAGRLSVVATPIGNLGDITQRAREVLAGCDLIAAEDTRHTKNLLRHLGVDKPLLSLHEHNEQARVEQLLRRLREGAHVALVSDAGTPAVSDPGFRLVRACAIEGIVVEPLPGACAAITALCAAGLPTDRFCFEGFLPAAAGARLARLASLEREPRTLVFYESPHRIADALADCAQVLGGSREAVVARELTKQFETFHRGSLGELAARALDDADFRRGEIVLLIAGAPAPTGEAMLAELDRVLGVLLPALPLKQAAALAAQLTGCRDNQAYRRALELKEGTPAPAPMD